MKSLHYVTFVLVVVGALNWGLVGLFSFNVVNYLLNFSPLLENAVYALVGVSAVVELLMHKKTCSMCGDKK